MMSASVLVDQLTEQCLCHFYLSLLIYSIILDAYNAITVYFWKR